MKHSKFLLTGMIALSFILFTSCGDAGVQIKVGDDYSTNFNIRSLNLIGSYSDGASTTINDELLDYGNFIEKVTINSIDISFDNIETPFNGQIVLNISGQTFDTGMTSFSNNNVIEARLTNLSAVESILESGDVSINFQLAAQDQLLADDDFDLAVTLEVFATVKADQ